MVLEWRAGDAMYGTIKFEIGALMRHSRIHGENARSTSEASSLSQRHCQRLLRRVNLVAFYGDSKVRLIGARRKSLIYL